MPALYPEYWPQFFTATILEWKTLLQQNEIKNIIVKSLQYLVHQKRIQLHAFVIMNNHLHLIWQPLPPQTLQSIQHSFLKHTAQEMKWYLQHNNADFLSQFKVNAKDRLYQFWERNALSVELRSSKVFDQKLVYIHQNPVKAGLCILAEEYYYSSANFYCTSVDDFKMLVRAD
ncbi:transposase [Ferruginibacter sp. SUN106]|uniref:transposase n=1 Tax=Ferruginibacter sp. SUN106 TaxID=2978348 RepID=UPI003D360421